MFEDAVQDSMEAIAERYYELSGGWSIRNSEGIMVERGDITWEQACIEVEDNWNAYKELMRNE